MNPNTNTNTGNEERQVRPRLDRPPPLELRNMPAPAAPAIYSPIDPRHLSRDELHARRIALLQEIGRMAQRSRMHERALSDQAVELMAKNSELRAKNSELRAKDAEIAALKKALASKDSELKSRDTVIAGLKKALAAQDAGTASSDAESAAMSLVVLARDSKIAAQEREQRATLLEHNQFLTNQVGILSACASMLAKAAEK